MSAGHVESVRAIERSNLFWIFSTVIQHRENCGLGKRDVPGDGGRATPPCTSLTDCLPGAEERADIVLNGNRTVISLGIGETCTKRK